MSFHNLSISVLKVGRQLAGSLAVAAFLLPSLTGCIKEERPVTPHEPGDVTTRTVDLSQDYRYQIFYSLEKDSVISRNLKTDWDFSFESHTEGSKVFLNSSRFMSAWNTGKDDFDAVNDTTGFYKNRRWDASNQTDSVAIGDVKNLSRIFWVDRGYDENGDELGYIKIKFVSVDNGKYVIQIQKQGDSKINTHEIVKNYSRNFSYFSFKTNGQVTIEPNKNDWDLLFTQYIHNFKDPYLPYLVTGVLLNPYNTQAVVDSTLDFNKIDITVANNLKLRANPDVIGYAWKEFGFSNSIYKVYAHWNFIIRDSKSLFYKLHFIDFYNDKGTKGYPKFELQKL